MYKAVRFFKKLANDKPILWGALGVLVLLRIAVHAALFFTSTLDGEATVFGAVTAFGIILLSALIPFKTGEEEGEKQSFIQILNLHFILILVLAVAPGILPFEQNDGVPDSILSLLVAELLPPFALYVAFSALYFISEQLLKRKHKDTIRHLQYIGGAILAAVLVSLITHVADTDRDPWTFIALVAAGWYLFKTNKKLAWLAALAPDKKKRIKKYAIFTFILSLVVAGNAADSGVLGDSLYWLADVTQTIVAVSAMLTAVYLFRIFTFSGSSASPESIVERRTKEVTSLAHLNKVVSETVNLEELMAVVTQLAQQISRSGAAWIELYDMQLLKTNLKSDILKEEATETTENQSLQIAAAQNITPEQAQYFHHDANFNALLKTTDEPILIESLSEHKTLGKFAPYVESVAKSMVIVPLYSGGERIGTLIVVNADEYGFEKDDLRVLKAFSDNISVALDNMRLLERSLEKERYERELLLAQKMQMKLLPQKLPEIPGYEISAHSVMAQEVGGDYYDVVKLRDGRPCIVIADVSGKGISAAFYMAKLKGVVLAAAQESDSLHDFLSKINRALFGSMERQMYITLACVVLEREPGQISFARAGHTPMLMRNGVRTTIVSPKGLGIGLAKSEIFQKAIEVQNVTLSQGDCCLLFTDGISERANAAGIELGYSGLLEVLRSPAGMQSEKLLKEVSDAADFHAKGEQAHDDMTVLAIVFKGNVKSELLKENLVEEEVMEFSKL
ncbi:MAG TPA: PP2C family protein-serine/threonine phosphatase [Patescibacteria group bacterium]|nr:PP2C family protein-serine/threonine phosphatase [Patescibacteria group bacterium]